VLEIVFTAVICVLSILLRVKVFSVRLCYTSEGAILVRTIYSSEMCNPYVRKLRVVYHSTH